MSEIIKAGQVPRDRIYGNFRKDKYAALVVPHKWRNDRERPGMSAAHLALIRKLPCTCCYRIRGNEAHHLKSLAAAKERGVGMKATDRWTVSMCAPFGHHHELEQLGSRREVEWFWDNFGINPHALADALWRGTGDLARMGRIMLAHKLVASKELASRKGKK